MPAYRLNNFGGIDELKLADKPNYTRNAKNVIFEHGRIIGRAGVAKLLGITTALSGNAIIGLAEFRTSTSTNTTLLAFTDTKAFSLNTLTYAWDDITGVALTAGTSNIVFWTLHKDVLCFTNGVDPPRRWTGTGNTVVLGGSPPISTLIKHFEGYLFLGDVTVAAVRFPSRIRYSEDYNVTWDVLNELNLTETPGPLKAWEIFGRTLYCYKADGVVGIRFIGGTVKFTQFKIPFPERIGIIAPLSLVSIPGIGHVFLGTDMNLYLNNDEIIRLMDPNISKTLQSTPLGWAQFAHGIIDAKNHKYNLFLSSGDAWLGQRIIWDYLHNRWSIEDYPSKRFNRLLSSVNIAGGDIWSTDTQQWQSDSEEWLRSVGSDSQILIAGASDKLVYKLDWDTDDDGTFVHRTCETDWLDLTSPARKSLSGIDLIFERAAGAEVNVSVAADFNGQFFQEKVYSLTGDSESNDVVVPYRISPVAGVVFNIKLAFRHSRFTSTSPEVASLKDMIFYFDAEHKDESQSKGPIWASGA